MSNRKKFEVTSPVVLAIGTHYISVLSYVVSYGVVLAPGERSDFVRVREYSQFIPEGVDCWIPLESISYLIPGEMFDYAREKVWPEDIIVRGACVPTGNRVVDSNSQIQ